MAEATSLTNLAALIPGIGTGASHARNSMK